MPRLNDLDHLFSNGLSPTVHKNITSTLRKPNDTDPPMEVPRPAGEKSTAFALQEVITSAKPESPRQQPSQRTSALIKQGQHPASFVKVPQPKRLDQQLKADEKDAKVTSVTAQRSGDIVAANTELLLLGDERRQTHGLTT